MFKTKVSADSKADLLNKSKSQRESREKDKKFSAAAFVIQRHWRRHNSNVKLRCKILADFNELVSKEKYNSVDLFHAFKNVLFIKKLRSDSDVLYKICSVILTSTTSDSKAKWYYSLAISKHSKDWLSQVNTLVALFMDDILSSTDILAVKTAAVSYLTLIRLLCSVEQWKVYQVVQGNELVRTVLERLSETFYTHAISSGLLTALKHLLDKNLARVESSLSPSEMELISELLHLVLVHSRFNEDIWLAMYLSVMATPCLVNRLTPPHREVITYSVNMLTALVSLNIHSNKIISVLSKDELLFLILNVIHLLHEGLRNEQIIHYPEVVDVVHKFLRAASSTTGKASHWHPILGLCETAVSIQLANSVKQLTKQIALLHSRLIKKFFFQDLLEAEFPKDKPLSWKTFFTSHIQSESKLLRHVSKICAFYYTAITTFEKYKTDILMSLCCLPDFLTSLWNLVYTEYSQSSKTLARSMAQQDTVNPDPFVPVLVLFCSCFSQYFIVLSDEEIYEKEQPFSLRDLITIAGFVNGMLFNVLWNNYDNLHNHQAAVDRINICHGLLVLLHERDQRRSFIPNAKFWTPKDASPTAILAELKSSGGKGRSQKVADYIPWIFPQKRKMEYLHSIIKQDKSLCRDDHQKTVLIKIHRRRLFEDGLNHLKHLADDVLKHQLKIMFINELGLEEAGIDQDGVLKEFLEETIKHGLDPSFGLFVVTEENQWHYPSPLSKIHLEYVELFYYLGRIIGKAVYEGITIDVNFAPFFIRQVLHNKNALFSYLDELPSLDSELYKNLTFVKTYDGNVEDLGLTFSVDENEFGKMVTYELIPGGSVTTVTNANKISYIHQVAHYKMYTQIQTQTKAFVAGFKAIINDTWLGMFSLPEIQKLISGDISDIDLQELKRHARYLGGYHTGHRVITWFWDVCINEFTEQEKSLLLKFVTSCSKPPLLGFGAMSPPFSIRAVDESDDGTDDNLTPGRVIRSSFKSFLGIQGSNSQGNTRLPTASTCFNLLKLPVYNKKSILREKLRYAINSSSGFELS